MKNKRLRKLIRICLAAFCSLSLLFVFKLPSFADDNKIFVDSYNVPGFRIDSSFHIGSHSGDCFVYFPVSSGVTYYFTRYTSGRSGFFLSISGGSDCYERFNPEQIIESYTPSLDGYIVFTNSSVCPLIEMFYYDSFGGDPDDPENPDDPDNPGGDVSGNDISAVVEALNITNSKIEKLLNHYVPSGEYVRGSEQLLNPVEYEFYDLLKIIAVSSVCINAFLLIIIFRRR